MTTITHCGNESRHDQMQHYGICTDCGARNVQAQEAYFRAIQNWSRAVARPRRASRNSAESRPAA